jgi:predicted O-methyltransferase YrrM
MNNEEIVDLVTYINRDTEMLEIGGGNSTIFLSKIVKKLVTIEHDENWSRTIKSEMEKSNFTSNWELHVVKPNWNQLHPFSPAEEGQFINYTNFILSLPDEQFDVILVDGRDRVQCVKNSISKLKKNGVLLIHDFWNREKYHSILDLNELDLIVDTNSYVNTSSNTLAAFKKII